MSVLRRIYGVAIPEPEALLRPSWVSDLFTTGVFAHLPPWASGNDYDIMAEPVGPSLLFAGEATSRNYPASAHGAYFSGLREAERALARTASFPSAPVSTLRKRYCGRADGRNRPQNIACWWVRGLSLAFG